MAEIALITGGADRIGKAIAIALANDGSDIVIHYNNSSDKAIKTADEIRDLGRQAYIIQADFSDTESADRLIGEINDKYGQITCLINNAASFNNDKITGRCDKFFNQHMNINLYAPVTLAQGFYNQLSSGYKGNIINIVDYCINNLPDSFFSYTISKSALWTATQIMAKQFAPDIRVNAIAPGNCMIGKNEKTEHLESSIRSSLLGTPASPDEICQAILFLLKSPSVTGQLLNIDSGKSLSDKAVY